MTDSGISEWIDRYERAWRSPGTDLLDELFTDDVTYVPSPWAEPVAGLGALRRFWEASRNGPDEGFAMTTELVAEQGGTSVVRVHVDYDDGERWRDLWIVERDGQGRCRRFEEWPFEPGQTDGHEDDDEV
jgi:ketosteroid isomerase-like protein